MSAAALALAATARRAASSLALAASVAFAFQPCMLMAQTVPDTLPMPEMPAPAQPVPKPAPNKPAVKKASRHQANDNVSDELNRRENERVTRMLQGQAPAVMPAATPAATSTAPAATAAPTPLAVTATPAPTPVLPTAPIVTASLTPPGATPTAKPAPTTAQALPVLPPAPQPVPVPVPQPRIAQTQPPAPTPVPIQPGTAPPTTVVTTGAPGRAFGQGEIVPTQQPTLRLEINKGTALRLPGPAATVFVAAPDIADVQVKSPTMIYVFAKKPGDTVLYAVDAQDHVLLNTIVSVTSPLSRIKGALDQLHPGNGVIFDNQGETIVLSGVARSAAIAEDARKLALQHVGGVAAKVVNNIRIDAPNQVQLRVKIAEVQRDALKRVGINWQNISSIALFGLGPVRAGFATSTIQATGGNAAGAIAVQSNDGSLTSLIDLLATQSQANVLAEPNLIAMSGETASFLAGGEIPVVSPQAGALTGSITVQYKQVGVSLAFTPTIIGDRINLKVAPEVSQVTTDGQVSVAISSTASIIIPAIATRRASTTVELGSGQSFAIAGLLQHNSTQTVTKLPALGDIPILGTLFKSDAYQRNETELVIIVTPYLVEPSDSPLRTPLTDKVPPTDADRWLMQRTGHPTPPAQTAIGREQQAAGTTAGFKLE